MRKIVRLLWIAVVLLALSLVGGMVTISSYASPVSTTGAEDQIVVIPAGASQNEIGQILLEQGLVRSRWAFLAATRWLGYDGQLKAGEYRLSASSSLWEIIEKLYRGEVITYRLTIPEGYTAEQIRTQLLEAESLQGGQVESLFNDPGRVADWVPDERLAQLKSPLEGYLFPDTYQYTAGMSAADLVDMMLSRFRDLWNQERLAKLEALGLSIHEAVTLASIVEKEARLDEERPIIAAVYLNRLKRNMKLDADPTVLYALGKTPGEMLFYKDLEIDSPYNTYRYSGLPPGPIASPGLKSIDAVLNPADVPYLYFVARNDGSHEFAVNYAEHLQNVARYRQ